jgi:hypothetical protein
MDTNSTTQPYSATTTTTGSGSLVTGLFPDRESTEAAYNAAQTRGYSKDDVNLVMSDETRNRHFSGTTAGKETELGNKAAEGAGIGAGIGGTVGAIIAGIAAIGTTLALIGWNIPEERVKEYEEGIKNGGILMGVRAKNDEDALHFENEWRQNSGQHIYR